MADLSVQINKLSSSIEKLESAIDKMAGPSSAPSENEDPLRVSREAQKAINDITNSLTKEINSVIRQIPVLGNTLANNIDKSVNKLVQGIGGGTSTTTKGALGVLAAGFAATTATIVSQLSKIETSYTNLAKSTGFHGQQLKNISNLTIEVYKNNLKYGLSMNDANNSVTSLITSLGSAGRVTLKLTDFNSRLAKYIGSSAEQAAGLTSTLVRGFGMTADNAEKFTNILATNLVAAGQNSSVIIRDMAANSNILTMHIKNGSEYLADMAKYSGLTGISIAKMQGISDVFLNMEVGAEMAQKINMWTGANLNSQKLFNQALRGDTLSTFKEVRDAFSSSRGRTMLTEFSGAARMLANQLGLTLTELNNMSKMTDKQLVAFDSQRKALLLQKDTINTINASLESQLGLYDLAIAKISQRLLPMFTDLSRSVYYSLRGTADYLNSTGERSEESRQSFNQTRNVVGVGAVGVGALLYKMLTKADGSSSKPWYVRMAGTGSGGGSGGGQWATGSSSARKGYQRSRTQGGGFFRSVGRGISSGYQSLSKGAGMKGLLKGGGIKGLLKGGAIGTIFNLLNLVDAISTGDSESIIRSLLSIGGASLGGVLGAIGGLGGSLAGGVAGGYAGGAIADAIYGGKAAMGSVVNRPSLFMVGEENRREVIIPTERIRQGLPIDASVAAELGSIGVPGFRRGGFVGTSSARANYATQGGQGVYAGSASYAETRRRQQEIGAVNQQYMNQLARQHGEIRDLTKEGLRQDRILNSYIVGGLNGINLENKSGVGFLKDYMDKSLNQFQQSVFTGIKSGYQIWKQGLDETKRVWVNAAEDTYEFINIFRDKGSTAAFSELRSNREMQSSMDNLTDLLIGGGEGKHVSSAIRTSLFANQLHGMSLSRSLALGGGQYLTGAGFRMNEGNFNITGSPLMGFIGDQYSRYENYSARRRREKAYSSVPMYRKQPNYEVEDYSELSIPDPLDMGGYLNPDYVPPGYGGFGRNQRNQFESRVGSSYSRYQTGNRYGMSDFGTGFGIDRVRGNLGPRNITARSESLLESEDLPKLSISDLDDSYMHVESSDPMDPNFGTKTDVATIKPPDDPTFQEKTGLNVGAMGAAAVGGLLSGFGQQGFNRQGLRSGVGQGLGAAGAMATQAAFKTGNPVAIAAAVGLTLGSFILPGVIPKSKSESRMSFLNQLHKIASGKRDIAEFSKSDELKKALKGTSSKTRTLTGLMAMFSNKGLTMGEAANLAEFLKKSKGERKRHADRFYWNQRLFDMTEEEMSMLEGGKPSVSQYKLIYGDKSLEDIQATKTESGGPSIGKPSEFYRELIRRVNTEHGRALKLNDYKKADGTVDETKLFADIQQTGFNLESYISSGLTDSQGPQGGGGGGGVLNIPPEFQQAMDNLNYNIQRMSQNQTIQILLDGQKLAEALVTPGS